MQATLDGTMLSQKDPIVTGVVYRIFECKDPTDPLHKTPYFGQTIGVGTPIKVAKKRWAQEISASKRSDDLIGLSAMLKTRGVDNCKFEVVDSLKDVKSRVLVFCNRGEIDNIANHGGVIRDMEKSLYQTLNRTKGGRGMELEDFAAVEARFLQLWREFVKHVPEALRDNGTMDVRKDYKCSDGYKFGEKVGGMRNTGLYLTGRPDEEERRAYLKTLPGWIEEKRTYSESARLREAKFAIEQPDYQRNRQMEYIEDARESGQLMEAARKQSKTKSSVEWKAKASQAQKETKIWMVESGKEAERIEKHKKTSAKKRQDQLDACKTQKERIKLLKHFAHTDKGNAERKRKREAERAQSSNTQA